MKRRELILALGGAAAWPIAARAQQPAKLPTIGFLGATTPSAYGQWVATFVQRLRELGWIEGRTVAIDVRWAEGRTERLAEIATEFVRLKVDVIVTHSAVPVLAAKQATSVIPIVFATAGDPVGNGLVASLARPGGNVTGLSLQSNDTAGKRLELLREIVPSLRRLAILANVGNPFSVLELSEAQAAARTLGLEVDTLGIRQAEDIAPAFEALKGRAEALYVCTDGLVNANRIRINTSALGARLPTVHGYRDYVEATRQRGGGRRTGAPPNHTSLAPACGSKTPPSPSRTPECPTTAPDGRTPSRNRDSSRSSPTGPAPRSPPRQTAPGASREAIRPPTAVEEIQSRGQSGENCSSAQRSRIKRINAAILSHVIPIPLSPTGC
jgi:putative ABC transport system substrate-binding protein